MKALKNLSLLASTFTLLLLGASCANFEALRPGVTKNTATTTIDPKTGKTVTTRETATTQSENPKMPSAQETSRKVEKRTPIPKGSKSTVETIKQTPSGLETNRVTTTFGEATEIKESEEEKTSAKIGAAQEDTSREISAKMAAFGPIMWVGVCVFLFGVAAMVWPPAKIIVGGSKTTAVWLILAGITLMVLPTLFVGNEKHILLACAAVVAIWFFAHHHGEMKGKLRILEDSNKNGIDDNVESLIDQIKIAKTETEIGTIVDKATAYPGGKTAALQAASSRRLELGTRGSV